MFKLESYITPFIIGYIDKYVKLKHEDFQLSLWGGDAVLNKLDLRLDAIEEALQLPVTLKSGHIHELRIHVPWTKLGSEPVVITVNTIECILKVRDGASDDHSTGSGSSAESPKPAKVIQKQQQQPPEQENLPPGYLQGYIKKIMNNVNILVNNLILKFVEEDVVLSLNVKSAELYTVGPHWERSFVDILEPELVLRRLLDLQDLTVCLDKRNASGKIDTYQDPLIYRCGLTCRIHSLYESLHSRQPYVTKLSILCEKLNLSLTDVQVPMFVRLLELCLALYYGVIGQKPKPDHEDKDLPVTTILPGEQDKSDRESWSSWAWSYMPQLLPEDEEDAQSLPTEKKQSVFSLGLYCTSATVIFKLSELVQDQSRNTPYRTVFKPCIRWEAQEIGLDVLAQGVNFVNVQFGLGKSQLFSEGDAICGVLDTGEDKDTSFFRSGQISKENQVNYLTHSLFDLTGAENRRKRATYCCELEQHLEICNENYAVQKYGTLYIDYCYVMTGYQLKEGERLSLTREGQVIGGKEKAVARFLVGPSHLVVSSSMVQRVHKLVYCTQHDYPPYFTPGTKEKRPKPDSINSDVVEDLERHMPSVTLHLTLFCPSLLLLPNELPHYDVTVTRKTKLYKTQRKASFQRTVLPGLLLQAQRMDFQLNNPMFPRTLVQHVSTSPSPPRNLLQHCYAHKNIKVFGLEAGFTQVGEKGQLRGLCNLWQPCSGAFYVSTLLLPEYWKGAMQIRDEQLLEVPQVQMTVRKSQLMLLYYMVNSWSESSPNPRRLLATSLMQDAIKPIDIHVVIELGSIEMKRCQTSAALSASLSLASVSVLLSSHSGESGSILVPVLRGPQNTSGLFNHSFLEHGVDTSHKQRELLTCTLQAPTQPTEPQAVGVVVVSLEGLVLLVGPELDKWLSYTPQCVRDPNGDLNLGQTSTQQADMASGSNDTIVTSMDTLSMPPSHSRSCSQNVDLPKDTDSNSKVFRWKEFCAKCYPLVKITEVQVDIAPVCVFMSGQTLPFTQLGWEVAGALHSLYGADGIAGCLCVCLPALHLNSLAHRRMSPTQELPIRVTELSIAGEKLPWLLKVNEASVYSIQEKRLHYVIHPASVKATIAVSSTYFPPVSQHLSALGLAVHADSKDLLMSLSHNQVELVIQLIQGKSATLLEVSHSLKILESICKKKVEEVAQPNVSFTRVDILSKHSLLSNSSQVDPIDAMDTEFRTVTSETGSLKLQNVMREEEEEGMKLSLWIQCTVMRVQLKLYSNISQNTDLKVTMEAEGMSGSVDVTQVYSKMITKMTSLSVMHHLRKEFTTGWTVGSCDGILLSSLQSITRNTYLSGEKAEKLVAIETKDAGEPDPSHSFITVTMTNALKKNVRRRLLLDDADELLLRATAKPHSSQQPSSVLTEVIVQMNPVDLVMNVPVLLNTLDGLSVKEDNKQKLKTPDREDSLLSSEESTQNASGSSYPLLYLNTKTIRVFVPCVEDTTNISSGKSGLLHSAGEATGMISHSDSGIVLEKQHQHPKLQQQQPMSHQSKENQSKKKEENVLLLEVCSIEVTAQPENPLPRSVVDKHLYKKALQSGILRIPGSDIEDRQYQVDFNGCSVTSGVWEDLVQPLEKRKPDITAVQNPALEWNNKSREKHTEAVQLTAVASNINVRVTVAPAMFYTPTPDKARVVCGHSLELNSRNDIDFFIATSQIKLAYSCLNNNLNIATGKPKPKIQQTNVLKDDAIGVDLLKPKPAVLSQIPLDVLLTAGRISILLYSDEVQFNMQLYSNTPGRKCPNQTLPRDSHHQSSSTLDSAVYEEKPVILKPKDLVPLILVQFSQPHSVLSLSPKSQKLELSCFDVALKGSTYKHCRNSLPDTCDFNTDLLITKPGYPDEKTGISPCLYTFRAVDFIKEPAKVNLVVERALKLNVNLCEIEKMMKICSILQMECFQTETVGRETNGETNKDVNEATGANTSGHMVTTYLELINEVDISTKQICTVLDTAKTSGKPVVTTMTFNDLEASVAVVQSHDTENQVSGYVNLGSLYTTITSEGSCKPLLGPTSPSLRLSMAWDKDDGARCLPRCVLAVKMGTIPIHFSKARYAAIQTLVNSLATFTEGKKGASTEGNQAPVDSWWTKPAEHRQEVDIEQTSDDLRSGQLQYVSIETNINELPEEGEVLFSNNFEVGEAGVAWCYKRARVVTYLKSAPLPLNMPLNFSPDSVNQQLQVPCQLEYWSELSQQYEIYTSFTVSEQKGFELDLSDNTSPKAAKIWRVLIRQPLHNHAGYVLLQRHSETSSVATDEEDYIMVNRPDHQFIEPLVSPLTVAASLQVASCYRRQCVPLVQLGFTADNVSVMVTSQSDDQLPSQLSFYKVQPSSLTKGHDVVTLKLHTPSVACSYTEGNTKTVNCQVHGGVELQVLEHKYLCKLPVLPKTDITARLDYRVDKSSHKMEADVNVAPFLLNIGPSIIHTLHVTMSLWTQPTTGGEMQAFYEHYVICNDTQEDLRLSQTDTEQTVVLSSRQALVYSWTTYLAPQSLQISLDKQKREKCDPFRLDEGKPEVRTLTLEGQEHTFIIEVIKLTNLQKQVVIRSTLLVASRVSESLEMKLLVKRGGHHLHTIQAESSLPSYTLQPVDISAIKLRLDNPQALWSQEILVALDTFKGGKVIKVPSLQSDGFIHLWCHMFQKVYGTSTQTMVVFSPLFVFKSEMPLPLVLSIETPRLKKYLPLELPGRSAPAQLPSIAGDMIHNVSFRLSHNMKASNPVIQLSSGMIDQVRKVELDRVDAEDLVYNWKKMDTLTWPYNHLEKDVSSVDAGDKQARSHYVEKHCVSLSEYSSIQTVAQQPAHSDIDLQVELSQCWPGCKTLLINVAPHILICNECDIDLWFIVSTETHWKLSARQTWAPPKIEGSFRLGLIVDHELHLSDVLELSEEDNKARYLPPKKGLLYTESYTNVCIPVISQQLITEVCYLTLHSTIHQNMRILTVREKLNVNNQTNQPLSILQYNIPRALQSKAVIGNIEKGTIVKANKTDECEAMLFWKMNPQQQQTEYTDCVQYILLCGVGGGDSTDHDLASCPIRLPLQSPARQSVSVPIGPACDVQVSIISQTQNGITYVVLKEEQPQVVLHNECDFHIHFAEAIKDTSPTVMYESQELIDHLPLVAASSTVKYTFSSHNKALSDTGNKDTAPEKIHFSVCEHLKNHDRKAGFSYHDHGKPLEWSVGVDIRYNSFVTIPGSGDIKIHTEEIGKTRYVYLSSITREEISAKEIRSRLKHGGEAVLVAKATTPDDVIKETSIIVVKDGMGDACNDEEKRQKLKRQQEYDEKIQFWRNVQVGFSMHLQQAAFSLMREEELEIREIVRLTLDQACVLVTKRSGYMDKGQRRPHIRWNALCGVTDLQLDNQVQKVDRYDFPVMLIKREKCPEKDVIAQLNSQEEKIAFFKSKEVFSAEICVITDLDSMVSGVETTTVNICPVKLFVEDTFVYFVLQNVELLIPVSSFTPSDKEQKVSVLNRRQLPKSVNLVACQFANPIVMERLVIQAMSVNVSVHASIKLFLAIDNSPLSFSSFERNKLCSTSQNLIRTITMHFASGALFRAGWLVGSLELIGNPTGLVRSVAVGVSDLILLPYQGLTQGPGAFVSGVTHGMTSFLRNISSGTILSITNFASSVSRNMERLSLDTDHRHRQEDTRRHRPEGLSEGLKQGLTGFGLSVLGAVAGIADQPLQIFTRPDGDASTSNVVVGVGRGLVGVLTKPVGGAAELVSQTGMGLLQGTGLVKYSVPRAKQQTVDLTELCKEDINYKLISQHIKNEAVVAKAVELCTNGRQRPSLVVLTETELIVIDEENPTQNCTLALRQINSLCHFGTTLYINHETVQENKLESEGQLHTEDRIKAFVIGASSGHSSSTGKVKSRKGVEESHPATAKLVLDLNPGSLWFQEVLHISLIASKGFGFRV